jgi:hypothetical protein
MGCQAPGGKILSQEVSKKVRLLAERHWASTSFQGSALERTVFEALPRERASFSNGGIAKTAGGACKTLGY